MKHNIRINGHIQEMDFELGSDILDKNGNEIFEGDKVQDSFGRAIFVDFETLIRLMNGEELPCLHYIYEVVDD